MFDRAASDLCGAKGGRPERGIGGFDQAVVITTVIEVRHGGTSWQPSDAEPLGGRSTERRGAAIVDMEGSFSLVNRRPSSGRVACPEVTVRSATGRFGRPPLLSRQPALALSETVLNVRPARI